MDINMPPFHNSTVLPLSQHQLNWLDSRALYVYNAKAPLPVLQDTDVLIEIYGAALNPVDNDNGHGKIFGVKTNVLGIDGSGKIVAVGSKVDLAKYHLQLNDEVVTAPNLLRDGTFQQYMAIDVERIVKKPDNVSFIEAAAMTCCYLSVALAFNPLELQGKTVFIPGGSGGVGHFAVQIAKIKGAMVITSTSRPEGELLLKKQYNADYVLNYKKVNVVEEVLRLTKGVGVDISYDSTYVQSSFLDSIRVTKNSGTFIVLGKFGGESSEEYKLAKRKGVNLSHVDYAAYSWNPLLAAKFSVDVIPVLETGLNLLSTGEIKPFINRVITLEEVAAAEFDLANGRSGMGKVAVQIRSPF